MEDDEIEIRGAEGAERVKTSVRNAIISRSDEEAAPQKRRQFEIPVPVVSEVEDYDKDVKPNFKQPHYFVRHVTLPTVGSNMEHLTYTADADDLEWLRKHSVWGEGGMRSAQLTPGVLERIVDIAEKATALSNGVMPNAGELANLVLRFASVNDTKVIHDVRNYWIEKRKSWGKPALREFWPPTPVNDTDPHRVFRPREVNVRRTRRSRKNDMNAMQRLQQLRDETRQLEELLSLVQDRELLKRRAVEHQEEIFYQVMHDLTNRKQTRQLRIKLHQRMFTSFRRTVRPFPPHPDEGAYGAGDAASAAAAAARRNRNRKRPRKQQGGAAGGPAGAGAAQGGGPGGQWGDDDRESEGDVEEEPGLMDSKLDVHPRLQGRFGDILAGDDSKLMQLLMHKLELALPSTAGAYGDAEPPSFCSAPGINCSVTHRKKAPATAGMGAAAFPTVIPGAPVDPTERLIARSFLRPVSGPSRFGRRPAATLPDIPSVVFVPRLHRAAISRAAAAKAGAAAAGGAGAQARKFRCRPRIGRCGRLIIDRVPVREVYGTAQRGGMDEEDEDGERAGGAAVAQGAAAGAATAPFVVNPAAGAGAPGAVPPGLASGVGAMQIEPPTISESPWVLDGEAGRTDREVYALPPPRWSWPSSAAASLGAYVAPAPAPAPGGAGPDGSGCGAAPSLRPLCGAKVGAAVALASSSVVPDLRGRVRRSELDKIMAMDDSEDEEVVLASRGHFVFSKDMEAILGDRSIEAATMGTTAGVREHPLKFTLRV